MDLWGPMISDLRAVLTGTGAFRDVRTWRLRPQHPVILPPIPGPPRAAPVNSSTVRAGDCSWSSPMAPPRGWHDGSATDVLADWSKTGPLAVLQPLPEQMWTRTGLTTVPVSLSAQAAGTPNSQLRVDYRRRRRIPGTPIPVLGMEPSALHSWARLAAGSASEVPLAATLANGNQRPTLHPLNGRDESGTALERFRASASPQAYQLAVCLSAVPLALPIMRLVQHVASARVQSVRTRGSDPRRPDIPHWRQCLRVPAGNPRVTTERVAPLRDSHSVLRRIGLHPRHAGTASQTFTAIAQRADGPVTADAEAFSWVHPTVAARLGLHVPPQDHTGETSGQALRPDKDGKHEQLSAAQAGITVANVTHGDARRRTWAVERTWR